MDRRRQQRLSLDLLRGFRAAAKHLSFTRAARELFVTQPAISREVKKLEEQLGQPLFRRVNRSLQLTAAGWELYRAVEQAMAIIDSATERIGNPAQRLSLTTTSALASLWLVPKLPGFTRLHAGVDVRIVASNDMLDIDREHLDLALRYFPPWIEPTGEPLFDYFQFPVCTPAYAASQREPMQTIDDLRKHMILDLDTILYGRPWSDWETWLNMKRIRRFSPRGTLRLSHYDQVIQAAKEGAGVAIGKWPHVMRQIRDGSLCAPLGESSMVKVGGFYVQAQPEVADRDIVKAFVGWLRDEVRRDGGATLQASARATLSRQSARSVAQRGRRAQAN
jgi:LysR family transcriptional regulator, glycine cleavage system transcriptional activator